MIAPSAQTRAQAVESARYLLEQKPVYLDTETTGLSRSSEIVEICIVDDDGQIIFESLIRPSSPIPVDARAIHHITDSMVSTAPTWIAAWPRIRATLFGKQVGIYNASFDLRLMENELTRHRLRMDQLRSFCILELYSAYRGEWDPIHRRIRRFSLESAGRDFNIPIPNSHRARSDSLLARAVLHCIAGLSY